MSLEVKIQDGEGTKRRSGVRNTESYGNGLKVYSYQGNPLKNSGITFTNDTYGADMNQNATVGGTPDGIHNGIDTVLWTGSALSGTWVFNSSAQAHTGSNSIDATSTINNDEAQFKRGSTIDLSNYVSLTGWIYITGWSASGTKDVRVRLRDAGVDATAELDLSTYINTTLLNTWQKFSIPLSAFSITDNTVDELIVKTIDIGGGQAPDYYLDDIQLEETGGPIIYKIQPEADEIWEVENIRITFVDGYTGTLTDGTMPSIPYDGFLGVSTLSNGIIITGYRDESIDFSEIAQNFIDLIAIAGSKTMLNGSDGTNTWVSLEINFPNRFKLIGNNKDKIEISVNDDLSGLLFMKAASNYGIIDEIT